MLGPNTGLDRNPTTTASDVILFTIKERVLTFLNWCCIWKEIEIYCYFIAKSEMYLVNIKLPTLNICTFLISLIFRNVEEHMEEQENKLFLADLTHFWKLILSRKIFWYENCLSFFYELVYQSFIRDSIFLVKFPNWKFSFYKSDRALLRLRQTLTFWNLFEIKLTKYQFVLLMSSLSLHVL